MEETHIEIDCLGWNCHECNFVQYSQNENNWVCVVDNVSLKHGIGEETGMPWFRRSNKCLQRGNSVKEVKNLLSWALGYLVRLHEEETEDDIGISSSPDLKELIEKIKKAKR